MINNSIGQNYQAQFKTTQRPTSSLLYGEYKCLTYRQQT
jgi:hypothetical protein